VLADIQGIFLITADKLLVESLSEHILAHTMYPGVAYVMTADSLLVGSQAEHVLAHIQGMSI